MEEQKTKRWHLSKYNIFAEDLIDKNIIYCVNLFSRSFIKLTREQFLLLFNLNKLKKDKEILKKFIQQKIIVNFDEYDFLLESAKKQYNSLNFLSLSICPTMDCNFNCPYCFEDHRSGKMSIEIQNKIINFIEEVYKINQFKRLHITWFGGEPLLNIEIIESLSKRLISFSKENNIKYEASIITNGYLLNQKNANILAKAQVRRYQITLDGINNIHNKTRGLKNGMPSFNKIIENLQNVNILGFIKIRQNIYDNNKKNIEELKNFLNDLKKISPNNIEYYFNEIFPTEKVKKNKDIISSISSSDYGKLKIYQSDVNIPRIKFLACGAHRYSFITIDELGNLYKCRDQVGHIKYSFGNIKNWNYNMIPYSNNFNCFINTIGALNDEECKECVWFPVCAGGCPRCRLFYEKKCYPYKNFEEEFILKIAEQHNSKINLTNNEI